MTNAVESSAKETKWSAFIKYYVIRAALLSILLQFLVAWSPSIIQVLRYNSASYTLPKSEILEDGATYDYIVVGAGAAGIAAASRLALAGADVLLVEAGGDPNLLSKVPAAALNLLGSSLDWHYQTIPNNKSCLSSLGSQCVFSRGKCLGGSTSINYMLYTRGHRHDFDFNITDWSWEDLKPYFLKYEGLNVLQQLPRSSQPYHNTTGTMKLEFFDDPQIPWHQRIVDGFEALNFPRNGDVNGISQIGVSRVVGYVFNGERMSTARAYLARRDVRRRIKVAKNSLCTGVIIDENNVTKGIKVVPEISGLTLRLYARKEVILSAGAIGTPQILMLSGIGSAKHLEEMKIPVRVDLPVGDNMSDHVLPLLIFLVDRGRSIVADLLALACKLVQATQYIVSKSGPFASIGLMDVNAFANTHCYNSSSRQLEEGAGCELPNMQIIHAYLDRNIIQFVKPLVQQGINFNDDVLNQLAVANTENAFVVLSPILLQPYSRGNIQLASTDPLAHPAIFPNYLSDKRDVDEMLRSITLVEHLIETPAFKNNDASILHLKLKGCPSYESGRRAYWRCYIRHMTFPVYHAVGTCSLGKVVDTRLRVIGVKGLRVADASIFPRIPRGNTEAATVAVGERVADFILKG